jgi:hypothetical protein
VAKDSVLILLLMIRSSDIHADALLLLLYARIVGVLLLPLLLPLLLQLGALLRVTACAGLQVRQSVVCTSKKRTIGH